MCLKRMERLLETGAKNTEVYTLNESQKMAVDEARAQIEKGQFLTVEQANKEIDEWLKSNHNF